MSALNFQKLLYLNFHNLLHLSTPPNHNAQYWISLTPPNYQFGNFLSQRDEPVDFILKNTHSKVASRDK